MTNTVRTRYAPSPTGYVHIGNLRTALYEYLVAKALNGKFVLRIEDTDQERYVEGAVDLIYKTLKLCGIEHDEGPDIGGPYAPYVQSERKGSYLEPAQVLVEKQEAYYCFCTKERLDQARSESEAKGIAYMYDGHCKSLSKETVSANLASGIPWVIRQKMPKTGTSIFEDAVFGRISIENETLEDQVLIKSDGMPTYNFANVVDDHAMAITHVVRGSEYLSSTPKYNLLYQAFGWDIPTYVHLPLIVKPDGSKISKRKGDAAFHDLLEAGYLPEAILNYIALLGWSPEGNQEIFNLDELAAQFDVSRISKSPSSFDMDKLRWFNAEYLRAMTPETFAATARPWIEKGLTNQSINPDAVSRILQARTEVLSEIEEKVGFFNELSDYDLEIYVHKKMKTTLPIALAALEAILPVLEALPEWTDTQLHDTLLSSAATLGIKNGQLLWPVRTALSGWQVTPGGAIEIAAILGREESLRRLRDGISRLTEAGVEGAFPS